MPTKISNSVHVGGVKAVDLNTNFDPLKYAFNVPHIIGVFKLSSAKTKYRIVRYDRCNDRTSEIQIIGVRPESCGDEFTAIIDVSRSRDSGFRDYFESCNYEFIAIPALSDENQQLPQHGISLVQSKNSGNSGNSENMRKIMHTYYVGTGYSEPNDQKCSIVLIPYKKDGEIYKRLDKLGQKLELEQYNCTTHRSDLGKLPKLTRNLDELPLEIAVIR